MLVQIQHMAQKEHKRRMNQDASSAHCPVAKRYGSLGVVPCKALFARFCSHLFICGVADGGHQQLSVGPLLVADLDEEMIAPFPQIVLHICMLRRGQQGIR